jgi:putative ABC transport system permease protein
MMNNNDVTELAEKAKQGSKTAFEKLYKEFYPKLYYFVKQNVSAPDAAEDITAETFCSAMEHISELHSSESFVGWLYCIAYHKCMDYNKKTALDRKCLDDAAEFAALGEPLFLPDDYAVNEQTKQQLQTIIDSLPPDMRSVIILYYYDNLSVAEVAKVIGTNKNNAAQKLHTARKKLRSKIEKLIGKGSLFSAVPLSAVLANLENAGLLSGAAATAARTQSIRG